MRFSRGVFVSIRSAEGPVRFYRAFFRENVGFFVVVARAPEASGDAWMRRFSEHARSYRVLD
ncbi:MAG: hypothetical protein RLP09_26270 [Sandaracinaceae bacterium]